MMKRYMAFIIFLAFPAWTPALTFEPAFPDVHFEYPVQVVAARDGSGRLFVVEQAGKILVVRPGVEGSHEALSLKVRLNDPEEGLLSLALHPDYALNGRVFVWYSVPGTRPRLNRLAEFEADASRGRFLPGSQKILLEVRKRWGNHNGACLRFGPDGYLYFGLGDGGSHGDPLGNAQNTHLLLGKMLRLDVDHASPGRPYGIPPDNPFVQGGGRPEIFAWGLRNPWRMSFDSLTGKLWVGDVGQDLWEEVDVVERGRNYGWNWREGAHPFRRGRPPAGLTDPIFDYGHLPGWGDCITGGVVVRGGSAASLRGRYLFGDFVSRRFWSLDADTRDPASLRFEGFCPEPPTSIDLDTKGDVWVCGYAGTLYRVGD